MYFVLLKLYSCCVLYVGEDANTESHLCTIKIKGDGVSCKIKERYKVQLNCEYALLIFPQLQL